MNLFEATWRAQVGNKADWPEPTRSGFSVIEVLPFLTGWPLDDIAMNYIDALRPSCWRVVAEDEPTKSDACTWRVTVYLSSRGPFARITKIVQEVVVGLRGDFAHGHVLHCARLARELP